MDIVAGLVVLATFIVLPVVATFSVGRRLRRVVARRNVLRDWARLLTTEVDASAWRVVAGELIGPPPRLEGRIAGSRVELDLDEYDDLPGSTCRIRVHVPLTAPSRTEVTLEPESTRSAIAGLFRRAPRVGDDEFDGQFHIVTTAGDETLQRLVSEPLREGLLYARRRRSGSVVLHLSADEVYFEERGADDTLEGYPELLVALCAMARAAEQADVVTAADGRFVMELIAGAPAGDEEAACRVCGVALGRERVCCVACGTPHHPDCWDYNGGCAIYACGCKDGRPTAVSLSA